MTSPGSPEGPNTAARAAAPLSPAQQQELGELLRQGYRALTRGDLDRAGAICRQVLERRQDIPQAHFLVGLTALEAGERKTAFRAFASVTSLDPEHDAAWAHLAKLLLGEGQVNRADAALAKAVARPPTDPMVQDLVGALYAQLGDHDRAGHWFQQAVGARPKHVPFLVNLGNHLVYQGDVAAAEQVFERVIAIEPNSPQAHWALAGARRATDDGHIHQLAELVRTPRLHPRMQAFYWYAMGKEHEDLGQWPQAMAAFQAGADARRQTVEYDEPAEEAMFAFLEEHFTADWLAAAGEGFRIPDGHPRPLFVFGQPRTGTTLVERILAAHSDVHAAGELQQFSLAIRRLSDHRDPKRFTAGLFDAARSVDPAQLGRLYLDSTRRLQGDTPVFIDKLPQNYLCLPLMLAALPDARIVHLVRGPMDACFASFKQLFADAYLHSYQQEEMARHHVRYRRLMALWRERFPERFLDVSYEALVADLDPQARRLVGWCGLEWQDACLAFHRQQGAVSTASAVQVREPAHTRSVGRWRRYGSALAPMQAVLEDAGVALDPSPAELTTG